MKLMLSWLNDWIDVTSIEPVLEEKLLQSGLELEDSKPQDGSYLIKIKVPPNRGDCLSLQGLARELAIVANLPFKKASYTVKESSGTHKLAINNLASKACPLFAYRILRDLEQVTSPNWLTERLTLAGIPAVSLIVDVSNYVMLELGQPLHSYDLDKLQGTLSIHQGANNTALKLLNDQVINLSPQHLLLSDEQGPEALMGVMGGAKSAISATTCNILLEAAYFDPIAIRISASQSKLQTEASYRFERGTNPELLEQALCRAAQLLQDLTKAKVEPCQVHLSDANIFKAKTLLLRRQQVQRLLGLDLSAKTQALLAQLGFPMQSLALGWQLQIPVYRHDLQSEIDLIEELAKLYGVDNIALQEPVMHVKAAVNKGLDLQSHNIRQGLKYLGYCECLNYSFVAPEMNTKFAPSMKFQTLLNPIHPEMAAMRLSLIPGLIKNVKTNLVRQQSSMQLFELSRVYPIHDGTSQEQISLGMIRTGLVAPLQWGQKSRNVDFFDLKNDLCNVLALDLDFKKALHPALHPGQSAEIYAKGQKIGCIGLLHPQYELAFELGQNLYFAEVNLACLEDLKLPNFQALNKYPSISRDIAVLVSKQIVTHQLIAGLSSEQILYLEQVALFDVYTGAGLAADQQSVSIRLVFNSFHRTLTDEEVELSMKNILKYLEEHHQAVLRI